MFRAHHAEHAKAAVTDDAIVNARSDTRIEHWRIGNIAPQCPSEGKVYDAYNA